MLNISMDHQTLSHELRIPLAGILGGAELLNMDDRLSQDEREQVEFILQSGNRLLTVVNKILESIELDQENNNQLQQITFAIA